MIVITKYLRPATWTFICYLLASTCLRKFLQVLDSTDPLITMHSSECHVVVSTMTSLDYYVYQVAIYQYLQLRHRLKNQCLAPQEERLSMCCVVLCCVVLCCVVLCCVVLCCVVVCCVVLCCVVLCCVVPRGVTTIEREKKSTLLVIILNNY
jgi:hypothetical protein